MSRAGRMLRALRARLHKALGWLAYRLGCSRLARSRYERVLMLTGGDFGAYLQLGRIAFDQGDYAGWRREFEHARRLDPLRFSRLQLGGVRQSPRLAGTSFGRATPGDSFDAAGERATWNNQRSSPRSSDQGRSLPGGLAGGLPGSGQSERRRPEPFADPAFESLLPAADDFASEAPRESGEWNDRGVDDCSSADERRRLASLGPIRPAELRDCNLDDLARRLLG
ncbi:MAG: hypothetical protein IT455_06575 [Planctomycetes bacterium]|nr:hypothetical protein [Planctomycetota bacterium]